MMELTNKNIEEYINRFLDGETTNAEEQAIYRFFCTGNVITKHLCINCIRGARIEKVELEEGVRIGSGDNPEMKLVAEENMQEILDSISTLPNLQQAILRMKHIEGFEVEEIARMTGSTPVAVRTNLSRARKKVREQFMIHNR